MRSELVVGEPGRTGSGSCRNWKLARTTKGRSSEREKRKEMQEANGEYLIGESAGAWYALALRSR